jgi:cytochrome c553
MVWALALVASNCGWAAATVPDKVGEAIYRQGLLASGEPLMGTRAADTSVAGAAAACVNCHRRSGLGSKEGRIAIPPVTGRYLFHAGSENADDLELPFVETMRINRAAYTDETLARAIREGLDVQGKPLGDLMPRFALGDQDMATLIAYLKAMDHPRQPGVTDTVLHFATIITPDADPLKRRGMLDVLESYFASRNQVQMAPGAPLRASRKMMFMVHRRWQLHVWELTGPAEGWEDQLRKHLAAEPVMAVISGLGGRNWAPVQAFCEHQSVPCFFPNVEVPPANADRDFYSTYFSQGVLLEAALIAKRVLDPAGDKVVKSVLQVYRAGDSGEAAAAALAEALKNRGITVRSQILAKVSAGQEVATAVRQAKPADVLVLWLRPPDLAALGSATPAPGTVYLSGLMSELEHVPLPADWRARAHLAYPFDLPERRRVRVDFPLGWFRMKQIPVVDERLQADTYLACGLVAETLSHMTDAFIRDYLVERLQDMLAHRIITGYYPRLALAPGQRFASKGGYIVRFAEPSGPRVVAEGEWIVP